MIYDVDIDMFWRLTMSKQWRENKIAHEWNNITYTIDDRVCNTVRDDSVTIYRHYVFVAKRRKFKFCPSMLKRGPFGPFLGEILH